MVRTGRAQVTDQAAAPAAPADAPVTDRPAATPRGPIRLLANENPYGPSPAARAAMDVVAPEAWKYPVMESQQLRRLIAEREGLTPAHVMISDGSGEALRIAALVHGRKKGEVVAAAPTFTFLQAYARQLGCTVREVPLDGNMRHELAAMASAVTPATSLVYVCNPNNPTGTLLTGAELRPFVRTLSSKAMVLVDEAYLDLWDDVAEHTVTDRVRAGDNVIVTRTFSKLHGIAGLRIGYAMAPPPVIAELERHRMSMLNLIGIAAATASYQDLGFQAQSRARIREALDLTTQWLTELGVPHVGGSRGNFVFFDTGAPLANFAAAMRRAGFLIGRMFQPYDTWCRVSMGTVEQMQDFAAAGREHFAARL
jgi:histidinol-phosphate aminotransferase